MPAVSGSFVDALFFKRRHKLITAATQNSGISESWSFSFLCIFIVGWKISFTNPELRVAAKRYKLCRCSLYCIRGGDFQVMNLLVKWNWRCLKDQSWKPRAEKQRLAFNFYSIRFSGLKSVLFFWEYIFWKGQSFLRFVETNQSIAAAGFVIQWM